MNNNIEYSSPAVHLYPCYSDMKDYGTNWDSPCNVNGRFRQIVAPSPATAVPILFQIMRPNRLPVSDNPKIIDTKNLTCDRYRVVNW